MKKMRGLIGAFHDGAFVDGEYVSEVATINLSLHGYCLPKYCSASENNLRS